MGANGKSLRHFPKTFKSLANACSAQRRLLEQRCPHSKKYDLAFSKLSAPACLQLHARSFTRQFEQDLPQSGFTCTSHCRHPNEGIQFGHARLRLLLRITVEATSVEALCTLARGYPFRREKHKTCELSQHRQRSIWQPLVKNGAEK